MEGVRALVALLLAVAAVAAAPTLIITTISSLNNIQTNYQYMYIIINNSSNYLNVSRLGVVVSPYSAKIVYAAANASYPPPISIFYTIIYVNATLSNNLLISTNYSLIKIKLTIKNYMPFGVPATVIVQKVPGVDIIASAPPTSIESLGSSTIYQWSYFIQNNKSLTIIYKIKDFGSFGAVNLPSVEVISDADIGDYISQASSTISTLNKTYIYLNNLTYGINIFTNILNNFTNNLNNLEQILNLSSAAFAEGAKGLNSSRYAILALNSQLSALSASLIGVAETLNRSTLLVQYEYAYLVTLANALESQSAAINAYEKSLGTTVSALKADEENLQVIYSNLQSLKQSLYSVQQELIILKQKINNIKTNNTYILNATEALSRGIDSALSAVSSAAAAVDAAQSSIGALINILSNTRAALETIGGQLSQVGSLLNSTAYSTRANASAFLAEAPKAIANASISLVKIANNLTKLNGQISAYVSAVERGAGYLADASSRLSSTIPQIEALKSSIRGELLALGLANSILSNYLYNITNTINSYKYYISIAETYEKIYNTTNVKYIFILKLPTAVNKNIINFNITLSKTEGERSPFTPYMPYLYIIPLALGIAALAAAMKISLRLMNRP